MWKKILLLLACTMTISLLWFTVLETIYAQTLVVSGNAALSIAGSESRLRIEEQKGEHFFVVTTRIDGNRVQYPQKFGSLLIPTAMILAWQLFSFFQQKRKQAIKNTTVNILLIFASYLFFLLLLTAYHTSGLAKYIYDMMMDTFYIIALVIILVDNIKHPVFYRRGS